MLESAEVIDVLSELFFLRGVPGHIRYYNGLEFIARAVQEGIGAVVVETAYIMPASPWANGFMESFNARLRDELLNGEISYSLAEARIIMESWGRPNSVRLHQSLGFTPPAAEVFTPVMGLRTAPQPRPSPPTALAPKPLLHSHST